MVRYGTGTQYGSYTITITHLIRDEPAPRKGADPDSVLRNVNQVPVHRLRRRHQAVDDLAALCDNGSRTELELGLLEKKFSFADITPGR